MDAMSHRIQSNNANKADEGCSFLTAFFSRYSG